MHERIKLEEAKHFYRKMAEEEKDRKAFVYDLSAFLSAARSVLQYALTEAKPKAGGQKWYDSHVTSSRILTFLKDKRDANIHTEPVQPHGHHSVGISAGASSSVSFGVVVRDKDGNVKQTTGSESPQQKPEVPKNSTTYDFEQRFDTWRGPENVLTLCHLCLQELERVINDGIAKGLISG